MNFLDENGEIADVPPEEAADPAAILSESDGPAGSQFESSIFCQTCVKNQLYFNTTLSEYLPDLDDPDYARYEAALPDFRKQLEDRYPQVCARCEPRVRAQLQQATYTAKSDHVRRMLSKSRKRRMANKLGWRSLVVALGSLGYWTSIAGQLMWHAMGALSSDRMSTDEMHPSLCIHDLLSHQAASRECALHFGLLASHALKLGILCLWWNPKWQHKLAGLEGRLENLNTYYQVQSGIIVLRFLVWAVLQNTSMPDWLPDLPKALHGLSLVLFLILTAWSNLGIIRVDTTPLVDWTQEIGPLLSERQFVPPQAPLQQSFSPPTSLSSCQQQLSIGSFGSNTNQPYNAWRPPTPPTEDPDVMDWEPLNSQFTAQPRKPLVKKTQPSPFHGTLPAMNPRTFQLSRSVEIPVQREAIGIPPGFFDSGRKGTSQPHQGSSTSGFAEPTFFPQQDQDALGLEKIFDDVFRLRDDAALSRAPQANAPQGVEALPTMLKTSPSLLPSAQLTRSPRKWSVSNILAAGALPFLCTSLMIWVSEDFGLSFDLQLKLYMCTFADSVCIGHLLLKITSVQRSSEYFIYGRSFGRSFGTALSAAEVMLFAALTMFRWRYGCEARGSAGQVDPLLFCGLIWQELYYLMIGDDGTEVEASILQTPPVQREEPMSSSPNPSEATTVLQTGYGRPRGNSLDSVASSAAISTTSATSTAPGWKTPKLDARRAPSIGGPSPGFGLSGLNLDDLGSSMGSGIGIAGPRQRATRGAYRRGR